MVGRGAVAVLEAVDELRAPEAEHRDLGAHDAVPAPRELFFHRGGDRVLEAHRVILVHDPARRVAAGLRILVVVDQAHHHLHVPLRLHVAAHDAEAHHGLAVAREEAGNDGVERALARPDLVRVARRQAESRAAVLQADAGARHHDA